MKRETVSLTEQSLHPGDLKAMYGLYSNYMAKFNSQADPPCRVMEFEEFRAQLQLLPPKVQKAMLKEFTQGYRPIPAGERQRMARILLEEDKSPGR